MNNRREFVLLSATAATSLCMPAELFAQTMQTPTQANSSKPDPIKPDLVKEFVIAGHVDLEKTKSMLKETPTLLNAVWDWGGGDYEMAIGGAGHMGRRDIATFLISQGSRFDIFVAAMLGLLEVVGPILKAFPSLAQSNGPHGIPLIAHARKGGPEAAKVVALLESLQP